MKRLMLVAALAATQSQADDMINLDLRAQYESRSANPANPYGVRDWSHAVGTGEMRWQWDAPFGNAVRGVLTARRASDETTRLAINELSLERPVAGGFASIGKKVMSWDVGYAFRPLDVVQQEDRRALYPGTLEGVPMVAWETFTEDSALTVVASNPGKGQEAQPRDDGSLAARYYRRSGSTDQYAVLRTSRRNGIEGGASFSDVLSDGVEVHGSILLQQRHDTWTGARWQPQGGGGKALAGMTWTTESKFSVMGEAWVDRTALPTQQRNLLVRGSWRPDDIEIAADVLWQPATGSRISSVSFGCTRAPWALVANLRHYGGVSGAVVKRGAIVTLQRSF